VAARFVTYLAQRTREKVEEKARRPGYLPMKEWARQREMIDRAVAELEHYLDHPSQEGHPRLWTLLDELSGEQNEYQHIHGGPVRIIKNNDLLLVEYALRTVLADAASAPVWSYQTARCYAERYDSGHGTGLTPASAPLVQDIVDFWAATLGLDAGGISPAGQGTEPRRKRAPRSAPGAPSGQASSPGKGKHQAAFTHRQGQFLAFIHLYRKLHRQGPAELDLVQYFRVTAPSAHGMVVKLEQLGWSSGRHQGDVLRPPR
jgi:hypothetical protein